MPGITPQTANLIGAVLSSSTTPSPAPSVAGLAGLQLPAKPQGIATTATNFITNLVNGIANDPKMPMKLATAAIVNAVVDAIVETPKERDERLAKEDAEKKANQAKEVEKKKAEEALAAKKAENDKLKRELERSESERENQRRFIARKLGGILPGDLALTGDYAPRASLKSSNDGKA
jgi:hypothetical protein